MSDKLKQIINKPIGWTRVPQTPACVLGVFNLRGFVIDRLTMAIRIKKENIGPAPETISGDDTMIDGVGKQEDRIITILKVDKLLERETSGLINNE